MYETCCADLSYEMQCVMLYKIKEHLTFKYNSVPGTIYLEPGSKNTLCDLLRGKIVHQL